MIIQDVPDINGNILNTSLLAKLCLAVNEIPNIAHSTPHESTIVPNTICSILSS